MKVYVAGKFTEAKRIREVQAAVVAAGHSISFDWTKNKYEEGRPMHLQAMHFAELDVKGVADADCVVAVLEDPVYEYRGTFTEIGIAIGQNKPVIVLSPTGRTMDSRVAYSTNVFFHHPRLFHVKRLDAVASALRLNSCSR